MGSAAILYNPDSTIPPFWVLKRQFTPNRNRITIILNAIQAQATEWHSRELCKMTDEKSIFHQVSHLTLHQKSI